MVHFDGVSFLLYLVILAWLVVLQFVEVIEVQECPFVSTIPGYVGNVTVGGSHEITGIRLSSVGVRDIKRVYPLFLPVQLLLNNCFFLH